MGSHRRAAAAFEMNSKRPWRWADRLALAAEKLERFLLERLLACDASRAAALAEEAGKGRSESLPGPARRTHFVKDRSRLRLAMRAFREHRRLRPLVSSGGDMLAGHRRRTAR